jgi:hypothetical protein
LEAAAIAPDSTLIGMNEAQKKGNNELFVAQVQQFVAI